MDAILSELFPDHRLPYLVIFARMMAAMFFGGLIGLERERRESSAGLRTHILVSLAAAVFAIIAIEGAHMAALKGDNIQSDPLRAIEAVTAGIAFLAAGLIVFSKGEVRGLTTGAGMWMSGATGLALGFGFWMIAVVASLSCFVVLAVVRQIEYRAGLKETPYSESESP